MKSSRPRLRNGRLKSPLVGLTDKKRRKSGCGFSVTISPLTLPRSFNDKVPFGSSNELSRSSKASDASEALSEARV